jgi:hypothetical protein
MAYVIDGNLYFQDGSNPPRQLTNRGEDWVCFFSEDGEKIFFLRGANPRFDLYSMNVDGSSEQAHLPFTMSKVGVRIVNISFIEERETIYFLALLIARLN